MRPGVGFELHEGDCYEKSVCSQSLKTRRGDGIVLLLIDYVKYIRG